MEKIPHQNLLSFADSIELDYAFRAVPLLMESIKEERELLARERAIIRKLTKKAKGERDFIDWLYANLELNHCFPIEHRVETYRKELGITKKRANEIFERECEKVNPRSEINL
tara:strand:- start:934 stop:1272 length:339 start_codon:yes stop_codon:yes gene_type:complete